MEISIVDGRKEKEFRESTKVLVDVFRSTTTMPYILKGGCSKIIPTQSIKEARSIKQDIPESLLIGERYGIRIRGFDYNNSPYEVANVDFHGKTVIFTSTNGTKVLQRIKGKGDIFIASFVNAGATSVILKEQDRIDIVLSNRPDGPADEDMFFGEYLRELLEGKTPDRVAYRKKIISSKGARRLSIMGSKHDIEYTMNYDAVDFPIHFDGKYIVRYEQPARVSGNFPA